MSRLQVDVNAPLSNGLGASKADGKEHRGGLNGHGGENGVILGTGDKGGVVDHGVHGPKSAGGDDRLRSEALNRIAQNPQLPTPPALALQVIQKANDPNCAVEDIAALVSLDSGMCGKLLKVINSALFSLPRAITSIELALNLMGIKQFRSLVLGLSLPAMQSDTSSETTKRNYWKSSVAGAIIARELAVKIGRPEPEDDLVTGLLRDIGEMVLDRLYPEVYGEVLDSPPEVRALSQCFLEERLFRLNHAEISAFILKRWGLPDDISEPIRYHHQPGKIPAGSPQVAERARILYFATRAAQLLLTPCQAVIGGELLNLARTQFHMNETQLRTFLEPIHHKVEQFAHLLNVEIGKCDSYPGLVSRAVEELVKKTVRASIDATLDEKEQEQASREAEEWRLAACRLRKDTNRDLQTNIFHRGHFDKVLAEEIKHARRFDTLLGLLVIDLDDFRQFNQKAGQEIGDQALQEIARLIRKESGPDVVLARFGGDEFGVLLPQATAESVQKLADRLHRVIGGLHVGQGSSKWAVSASIGAVLTYPRGSRQQANQVQEGAVKAVTQAKSAGKNQVAFLSLLSEEDQQWLDMVQQRLFSNHLISKGLVSGEQINQCMGDEANPVGGLGRLARYFNWIRPRKLKRLLHEAHRSRRKWLDLAIAQQYLTPTQVAWLLALQRERPEILAESLVENQVLTEQQADREKAAYYKKMGS